MTSIELLKGFNFFDYVLTFFILSIIGWVGESLYCSLAKGKFVNRGFLTGPMCPIYGTGAVVFMVALTPFSEKWYLVLLIGMILADTVEYITSFLMEKLFHARWWDLFQPFYLSIYLRVPEKIRYIVLGVIFFLFILDLINAVKNAIDVRKFMNKLHALSESASAAKEEFKEKLGESKDAFGAKLTLRVASLYRQIDELRHPAEEKEEQKKNKKTKKNRIYRAYENIQSTAERSLHYAEDIISELKKRITDDSDEMF